MKRMLLVLALAGGVMGCDAGEKLRWSPPEPKVNPLTLLDLNLGIEVAVCKYGIDTHQLKDKSDCDRFWKDKLEEISKDIGNEFYGGRHYPELSMRDVKYGVGRSGYSLMIYVGDNPNKTHKALSFVMIGDRLIDH